jgi:hypothetical protein
MPQKQSAGACGMVMNGLAGVEEIERDAEGRALQELLCGLMLLAMGRSLFSSRLIDLSRLRFQAAGTYLGVVERAMTCLTLQQISQALRAGKSAGGKTEGGRVM